MVVKVKRTILTSFFFLCTYMHGLSCVVEAERQSHTEIYHHCFEEAFSSFMVVFTTGFRLNLTRKVSIDFLCVYFDRNKQQPQHSWTDANVLAHLMFSSFPLTYKNSKFVASSSDFEGYENLTSPTFSGVNLLKVSVSEYFLSQFLGQEDKIDFNQFTFTKVPLFCYTRLKKVSKHHHLSLRQHQKNMSCAL